MEDRREFEEFYRAARDHCLHVVLITVGDRHLADDLVAEAFARAWGSWRKVREHPAPRAWVVRTALNMHVSWWRRRSREVALGSEDAAATASQYPGLDSSLVAALRRLPARQREVIVLRLLLDLDTATTARTLGVPSGTVASHLHRGRVATRSPRPRLPGAHHMNDTRLADAVRNGLTEACDSLSTVHLAIPASEIMARADETRRHRRQGVLAGAGGLAAAAVAVGIALPASQPGTGPPAAAHPAPSHPAASHPAGGPGVRLTAWTVTRQARGSIRVAFREATDAAGLQRTLRADGVPASVTFTGQQNPACQPYSAGSQALWPFGTKTGPLGGASFVRNPKAAYNTPDALVIRPSALPAGAGLQIWTSGTPGAADNFQLNVNLVKTSPECTGS